MVEPRLPPSAAWCRCGGSSTSRVESMSSRWPSCTTTPGQAFGKLRWESFFPFNSYFKIEQFSLLIIYLLIFIFQEDYLFMYCALEAFVTNNGTTIPSPVDIDKWNSNPPFQLNGCVRVSRVYTDSSRISKVFNDQLMTDSMCGRIPPDGQESAALLKHAEHCLSSSSACMNGSASSSGQSTSGCSSSWVEGTLPTNGHNHSTATNGTLKR